MPDDPSERAVAAAMRSVDRRAFLPPEVRPDAGADRPLPIGHGATNSQPRTVADMLRLLDVAPGMRVLDVGAGSGWTCALLRRLVGPDGSVIGVELERPLVAAATANLHTAGIEDVLVHAALPNVLGWPHEAPYDRILVSAMADALPAGLVEQLAPDGIMVIPVDGWMLRVRHTVDGVVSDRHGQYRFVPLR